MCTVSLIIKSLLKVHKFVLTKNTRGVHKAYWDTWHSLNPSSLSCMYFNSAFGLNSLQREARGCFSSGRRWRGSRRWRRWRSRKASFLASRMPLHHVWRRPGPRGSFGRRYKLFLLSFVSFIWILAFWSWGFCNRISISIKTESMFSFL